VANLEARAGRSFADLLGYWSLSWVTDDRAGVPPTTPELQVPSWDTPDIFRGLNSDFPARFTRATPVQTTPLTFGSFAPPSRPLLGGTATLFELFGTQSTAQILELLGPP